MCSLGGMIIILSLYTWGAFKIKCKYNHTSTYFEFEEGKNGFGKDLCVGERKREREKESERGRKRERERERENQ